MSQSQQPMDIESAIHRFTASQARLGIPAPSDPASDDDLALIAEAIAPMRLPYELVALWKRFQKEHGALAAGWELASARYALEAWQHDVDSGMGIFAKCLFPIAFEYQAYKWIELHGPSDLDGGRIWEGAYDTSEVRSLTPTLRDLLICVAEGWDAGIFEYRADDGWPHLEDYNRWHALLHERFGEPLRVDGWDRHSWPNRWKSLSGLKEELPYPPESITRIADLPAREEWLTGGVVIVEGEADGYAGGLGARAIISDGTGQLEVWIPNASDPFRDLGHGRIQLEVVRSEIGLSASDTNGIPKAIATSLRLADRQTKTR
jgi:hypothetical protein